MPALPLGLKHKRFLVRQAWLLSLPKDYANNPIGCQEQTLLPGQIDTAFLYREWQQQDTDSPSSPSFTCLQVSLGS